MLKKTLHAKLEALRSQALQAGATDAAVLEAAAIRVEERLANMCREPQCENFGLGASCPPHVGGPGEFRKLQAQCTHAIVIRFDVLAKSLSSHRRPGIMRRLHETVASIEKAAIEKGFSQSRAFAAGSCKTLFCTTSDDCCLIADSTPCRHPRSARPSMSGFGIDVGALMQSAGWPQSLQVGEAKPEKDTMSWVAGLVMIG